MDACMDACLCVSRYVYTDMDVYVYIYIYGIAAVCTYAFI